jgi:PAS domain S-box-containing protein
MTELLEPRPDTPQGRMWAMVKLFFEGLDMGVVIVRRGTHTIVWSSQVANRQLGYSSAEMLGRDFGFLYTDPAEIEAMMRRADAAFDRVGVFRGEIRMQRKDGTVFDTEQSLTLMMDPTRFQIAIRDISARKDAKRELQQSRDELRALSIHLQTLREQERARIARGLQEELGQELTALTLDLKLLRDRAGEEHRGTLDRLIESTASTVDHVQQVCAALRPAILDHLGLVAAIEWAADDFERRTGIRCEVDLDPGLETLKDPYAIVLLRIVQESLLNVRRHAAAGAVRIHLGRDSENRLVLSVSDDGRGIAQETLDSPQSLGLLSLRERARALGGRAEIRRRSNGGTVVDVRVPPPGPTSSS